MAALLLIEDDLTFSRILEGFLSKNGHTVKVCHTGKDGLRIVREQKFDTVLLDYRLPDTTGLEVLEGIKAVSAETAVIIMTGFSDIRTAVKAMKAGAMEYITKPINPEELLMLLQQSLQPKPDKATVKTKLAAKASSLVQGVSASSKQLYEHIRLVAPTDFTVIIEGESGTGKENVARSIHRLSKRGEEAFVAVDCGALSKDLAASELFGHVKGAFTGALHDKRGQFEEANGGTLFLDEVGNLSYEVQVKLLRAIQERIISPVGSNKEVKVDVRIITATNDDLFEKTKTGTFREDLYHRLNEFKLRVPPLRERGDDLMEFIEYFRRQASDDLQRPAATFSPGMITIFKTYDWPGNLRELRNVIKRAVLLTPGDVIDESTLPSEMVASISKQKSEKKSDNIYDLKAMQETQERDLIVRTLHEVKYNKSKAARLLNIDRKTLYLKMEKYGIE
ncbi:MAG: sigma-54-dependent Fis family transcriptional regulator [Azospira oryzae]|jgi:two-component system response regulator HydG|nr:MAG: sigma-54-dependent Fis family transcriptional regulator [Azospira oryzae]